MYVGLLFRLPPQGECAIFWCHSWQTLPSVHASLHVPFTLWQSRGQAERLPLWVLPEIVWVLGRTWVVPKGVPSFVRTGWGRRDLAGLHQPQLSRETQPLDASTPPCLPLQRGGNWMALTQKPDESHCESVFETLHEIRRMGDGG